VEFTAFEYCKRDQNYICRVVVRPFQFIYRPNIAWMIALLFSSASVSVYSQIVDLGDAQGFNATIFGDLIVAGGDTEGRLAVGGNASFTQGGYTVGGSAVGVQNPSSSTRDDLVIGGNADRTGYIGVEYGNVKVGGNITGTGQFGVTLGSVQSNVPNFATSVFDFAATESLIRSHSSYYSGLASNGTIQQVTPTLLRFIGTSPTQNVFHVTSAQWNGSGVAHEFFVPTGSELIINISGSSLSLTNAGMYFLEETAPDTYQRYGDFSNEAAAFGGKTVINAYEATTISSTSSGWQGMMIAPDAALTGSAGWINGQSFLGSADNSNGFEFHNFFTTVPPVIPEPATLLMAGILLGTCSTVQVIRKRRRS